MKSLLIGILLALLAAVAVSDTEEIELRVMTFNVWYGGEQLSFSQTVDVVRAGNADLIGIQEPDGNLRLLANASGYSFVDEKRNIISRYPLFDPDTDDRPFPYTLVQVRPGQIVAFANTHLPSTPFGPDLLRDGGSPPEVIALEKQIRLPDLEPYIKSLTDLVKRGIPVFFSGDFNSPSHLDWSQESAHRIQIDWPVTRALSNAGFRDAYREVYPDPVRNPGLTYTPGYPYPYVKSGETHDRIDMIWAGGKTRAVECRIIGERGNPQVDISIDPYPSDHRAVVAAFHVIPADAPPLIAVEPSVVRERGDFLVRFQTPNLEDWGVAIISHGGSPDRDVVLSARGANPMSTRPSIRFGSLGLPAGAYDAVLLNTAGKETTRTVFRILASDQAAELYLEKSVYSLGEAITVSWRNAPGMMHDWIGVYHAGDPDVYGGYIAYLYTGAKVEGSAVLDDRVFETPLPPGAYEIRLMREDSYVMVAKAAFSVSPSH